jgi:hypothetical protein
MNGWTIRNNSSATTPGSSTSFTVYVKDGWTLTVDWGSIISNVNCISLKGNASLIIQSWTFTSTANWVIHSFNGDPTDASDMTVNRKTASITIHGWTFSSTKNWDNLAYWLVVNNNDSATIDGWTFNINGWVWIVSHWWITTIWNGVVFNFTNSEWVNWHAADMMQTTIPAWYKLVMDTATADHYELWEGHKVRNSNWGKIYVTKGYWISDEQGFAHDWYEVSAEGENITLELTRYNTNIKWALNASSDIYSAKITALEAEAWHTWNNIVPATPVAWDFANNYVDQNVTLVMQADPAPEAKIWGTEYATLEAAIAAAADW